HPPRQHCRLHGRRQRALPIHLAHYSDLVFSLQEGRDYLDETPRPRSDRGHLRKVEPELVQDAIEQVLPDFHEQPKNIALVYRRCIERGLLRREQVAPNTFRRVVNRFELLTPETASENKKQGLTLLSQQQEIFDTLRVHCQ